MIDVSRPPDDWELDEIRSFLEAEDGPEERMPFVACEGFLTGIISGPVPISPNEWFPKVLGGEVDDPSETADAPNRIAALLLRWYNELAVTLAETPELFAPHIGDSDGAVDLGSALLWAHGYFDAVLLRLEEWQPLFKSQDANVFTPIVDLLNCGPMNGKEKFDRRAARKPAAQLLESVTEIYEFWLSFRADATAREARERRERLTTIRRDAPKIGRNAPCPCGSGRKFKVCSGRSDASRTET